VTLAWRQLTTRPLELHKEVPTVRQYAEAIWPMGSLDQLQQHAAMQ
jgi:hypothetical protein